LERELNVARFRTEEMDRDRRESISTLHTNMFKQLLDAEADHESNSKNYAKEMKELKQRVKYLELENSTLKESSSNTNASANKDKKEHPKELSKESNNEDYKLMYEQAKQNVEALQREVEEEKKIITKWCNGGEKDVGELKQIILRLEKEALSLHSKAEEAEKNRRSSISYLSNQMMSSLVDAEDQHENEIKEMRAMTERLIEEKKVINIQMHEEERKRKNSNAEVSSTMFQKLLLLEQEKEEMKKSYEQQIKQLQQQLEEHTAEEPRRASQAHTSMFKSLLDAEADHQRDKEDWKRKEEELREEIKDLNEDLQRAKTVADTQEKNVNNQSHNYKMICGNI